MVGIQLIQKPFFFLLNSDNKTTMKHNIAWDLYVVATGESCGNGIWETILGMLSVSPFLLKNPFNFSEFIYLYISSESNVRMYLSMQACYHSHSPKRIGQELQDYKKHQVQAGTMTGFLECCNFYATIQNKWTWRQVYLQKQSNNTQIGGGRGF